MTNQDYRLALWSSEVITIHRQRFWQPHILNDYRPTGGWNTAQSYHYSNMPEASYGSRYQERSVVGKPFAAVDTNSSSARDTYPRGTSIAPSRGDLKTPCHRCAKRFDVSCALCMAGDASSVTMGPDRGYRNQYHLIGGGGGGGGKTRECDIQQVSPFCTGPEVFTL